MKAFTVQQKELNYLILSTLAQNQTIEGLTVDIIFKESLNIDTSIVNDYTKSEIIGRLKALKNRGIVQHIPSTVIDEVTGYPVGYWLLTDKGRQAYVSKDWLVANAG